MFADLLDAIQLYVDAAIEEKKPTSDCTESVNKHQALTNLHDKLQVIEFAIKKQQSRLDHYEECLDRVIQKQNPLS